MEKKKTLVDDLELAKYNKSGEFDNLADIPMRADSKQLEQYIERKRA
jgi:hypothetical protein